MSRILLVDPIGGAAGDMLLAALLDAGAPRDQVQAAIDAVVPGRFTLDGEDVQRGGLRALALRANIWGDHPAETSRSVSDLIAAVDGASISERVKEVALKVLRRLGDAEATVHGGRVEGAGLHELGDDDTLHDVVGVSAALAAMDIDRVLVSALPLGAGGTVPGRDAHREIPLPAPAVLDLLRGFPVRGAGRHETVTPTAAAIFAALAEPTDAVPAMTLESVGYGAGARDPADWPNVLRVMVGSPASQAGELVRTLTLLEANLDDLVPELLSDATRALFEAGALDVWTTPVQMKKGRSGMLLSALCEPTAEVAVRRSFFEATSTLGVRATTVLRSELERRTMAVSIAGGSVRVKVGMLEGRAITATPEHDDVAALARQEGRPVREVYEEAAAAARLLREQEVPQG